MRMAEQNNMSLIVHLFHTVQCDMALIKNMYLASYGSVSYEQHRRHSTSTCQITEGLTPSLPKPVKFPG